MSKKVYSIKLSGAKLEQLYNMLEEYETILSALPGHLGTKAVSKINAIEDLIYYIDNRVECND